MVCNMVERLSELVVQQPILRNAPLSAVIAQVRFQEVLGLSPEDVRPLQKVLADEYPLVDREEEMEMQLGPEGLAPTGNQRRKFRFRDSDQHWSVTLTPTSLSVETSAYTDFKDFGRRWMRIAEPVVQVLEIPVQERLGLRYVNHLAAPDEPTADALRQLVRPDLVALVGAHARTRSLRQSLQEARFAQDDGVITLRHGLVRSDESGGEDIYMLDLDYYVEERRSMDPTNQLESLIAFNHGIYELFRWSVTDSTFATFDPEESEGEDA